MGKKRKKLVKQLEAAFMDAPFPPEDDPIVLQPAGWYSWHLPDFQNAQPALSLFLFLLDHLYHEYTLQDYLLGLKR